MSWVLPVVTTSSAMRGCQAEQLELLVLGLRFARLYFRTISLPNLGNRNQSLPELWRHARVQAIRCTLSYPTIWEFKILVRNH